MSLNATFWGQLIAFAVFVWFCMKFIWPVLLNKIEEREQRIADGLAAGEQGEHKLVEAEQRFQEMMEEGRLKAKELLEQAKKRGDELIEEAKQQARKEGERQLGAARGEIQQERERVREELKQQLAALVVTATEQILLREVDQKTHNEVLNRIRSGF